MVRANIFLLNRLLQGYTTILVVIAIFSLFLLIQVLIQDIFILTGLLKYFGPGLLFK